MTPEEKLNLERILASPSYRLAEADIDLLASDPLRPVRLQLELLKAEIVQQHHRIRSTIVVFGSTRVVDRPEAERRLAAAERAAQGEPSNPGLHAAVERARSVLHKSRYYDEARELGRLASRSSRGSGLRDFVVVTGGGPGLMEAANRGAWDARDVSIGLNITLPHEQRPNPYITPELCFQFHYFALRKMHFMLRARALVAFPGGYGTLDELFEVLTLIQTGKSRPLPVVLVGRDYWEKAVGWRFLLDEGVISPEDLDLFSFAETAKEVWEIITRFYADDLPRDG